MTADLSQVAAAYRGAAAAYEKDRSQAAAAKRARDAAREALTQAIVEQARAGMRQRDILDAIGDLYTRERVRQILRAAGVEPPA